MRELRTAVFSDDRRYRYSLTQLFREGGSRLCNFVMLNPSTADETVNDPTVERCERRARSMGYDGYIITNIFAYRATDPKDMKAQENPVEAKPGENDYYISQAVVSPDVDLVVCAWGSHGSYRGRSEEVRKLLREVAPNKCSYLKLSQAGEPCHPLYISYGVRPKAWAL